jgi:hypothetical protein
MAGGAALFTMASNRERRAWSGCQPRSTASRRICAAVSVPTRALARAFRYQRLLDEGRYASISDMATGEKIERGYLGTLLRLTLLAPDLVGAILNGRQPEEVTLPRLLEGVPAAWGEQRVAPQQWKTSAG